MRGRARVHDFQRDFACARFAARTDRERSVRALTKIPLMIYFVEAQPFPFRTAPFHRFVTRGYKEFEIRRRIAEGGYRIDIAFNRFILNNSWDSALRRRSRFQKLVTRHRVTIYLRYPVEKEREREIEGKSN